MEVECLALKDLTSPRNSFKDQLEEEDEVEQKVIRATARCRDAVVVLCELYE